MSHVVKKCDILVRKLKNRVALHGVTCDIMTQKCNAQRKFLIIKVIIVQHCIAAVLFNAKKWEYQIIFCKFLIIKCTIDITLTRKIMMRAMTFYCYRLINYPVTHEMH